MGNLINARQAGNVASQAGQSQVHITVIQNGGICPAGQDTTVLTNANPLPVQALDPGFYTGMFISSLYITFGVSVPGNLTVSAHAGAPSAVLDIHTVGPSFFVAATTIPVCVINDIPPAGYPAPTGSTPGLNFWYAGAGGPNPAGYNPFISMNPLGQAVTLRANSECLFILARNADV